MTLNQHEKFAGSIRTCVAQRKQNRSTENRTLTPKLTTHSAPEVGRIKVQQPERSAFMGFLMCCLSMALRLIAPAS